MRNDIDLQTCVCLNPPRDHLVQLEKQNPALDWEHTTTLRAGLIQAHLGKDQINFSYFLILIPNYKVRFLWLVPKVKIGWFRSLFISTGCGITSLLDKLDIFQGPGSPQVEKYPWWLKQHYWHSAMAWETAKVPKLEEDSPLKSDAGH